MCYWQEASVSRASSFSPPIIAQGGKKETGKSLAPVTSSHSTGADSKSMVDYLPSGKHTKSYGKSPFF